MDTLSYIKQVGFIWGPEPEIYGGQAGLYTYAPLGKLLKNKVESKIRELYIKYGFHEVECPVIMPKKVWKASNHWDHFSDPMLVCSKCNSYYRADKLIEDATGEEAESLTKEQMLNLVRKSNLKCESCKSSFKDEIIDYNLMLKTTLGLDQEAAVRPETATTTYLPFRNYYDYFRKTMPFGVFQIGKAFRNEISPRQNVMRGIEFTQAEAQLFVTKQDKKSFEKYKKISKQKLPLWIHQDQPKGKPKNISLEDAMKKGYLKNQAYAYCVYVAYQMIEKLGIPKDKIRIRQHKPSALAFYADDAWDLEINLPTYSWYEVAGIHDRTDFDLKQHEKFSSKKLSISGEHPHILEIAFGSDRPVFGLIDIFLEEEKERTVLKLPKNLSPITVAVFPLVKKDGLPEKAKEVLETLSCYNPLYDETGSIGKRYRRMDQVGTPFCVTLDHESLEKDTVTLRHRDNMKQERVKISDLPNVIYKELTE